MNLRLPFFSQRQKQGGGFFREAAAGILQAMELAKATAFSVFFTVLFFAGGLRLGQLQGIEPPSLSFSSPVANHDVGIAGGGSGLLPGFAGLRVRFDGTGTRKGLR